MARSRIRRSTIALLLAALPWAPSFGGAGEPGAALGPLEHPLWLRHSAISPDGKSIAFAFEGNLFVVPAGGGQARLLVGNGHHNTEPVWSPDSRLIAYASDLNGNFDVFAIAADGGPARRLTTHSASELPFAFTPDGAKVLFSAQRGATAANIEFPSPMMGQLYEVDVAGGREPTRVFSMPALAGRFDRAGTRLVYEDLKGYENLWRKHHVAPVAHDVWLYDTKTGEHRKLTGGGWENRNPVWAPDQKTVYFLSEKSGSFNVWKMPADDPAKAEQVTHYTKNPVRFLSMADDGLLSFGYDGELYTLAPGGEPQKVAVSIGADTEPATVQNLSLSNEATELSPSPDGDEIAFVVRGQVFVASTEFGDTRRISDGAGQKRSVSFSPDGRHIVYAAEQDGHWRLEEAAIAGTRKEAPHFFDAAEIRTRTLLDNEHQNFQPVYSPDGREVAYLEDRVAVRVLDRATGKTREVMAAKHSYSYSDGDQWFAWSPDAKSLLVNFIEPSRWSSEVGLVPADGSGTVTNLSLSGYEDAHPIFARKGQVVLWETDRWGLHGQPNSPTQGDVQALFLTRAAFDRFNLDKAEFAALKKREDEAEKGKDEKKDDKKDDAKKDDDAIKLPPPVAIDSEGLHERVARLTPYSSEVEAFELSPDGEALYYVVKVGDGHELWVNRMRAHEPKKLGELPGGPHGDDVDLQLDAKGDTAFVLAGGNIQKFKVGEGDAKPEPVHFSAALRLDRAAERRQMFEHVWRQTREKLYVTDMGGVDWDGYREVYAKFLPYIADNYDLAEMLSEYLGELNVSHTGSGYRPQVQGAASTGQLGVFVDPAWHGAGLKVGEVLEGGPLDKADAKLKAGMVIEAIDGTGIAAGAEYDSLLDQKVGRLVRLSVLDPASGKRFEQTLKPIAAGAQNELLYQRWVRRERELVHKLSGGRLGYVHVRGMDDESFRQTYADALGIEAGKEALIVDTRFNGGGNLHDTLTTFLSGERYLEFLPRGQSLGWEPTTRWTKPSVVLISESNYSDAHLFPWTYQHFKVGKLIGMPVAGTGTAVWWENLQDRSVYFGIPEVGFRDAKGNFMEKAEITPDVIVANDPGKLDAGEDQQLEAAVKTLLAK